jgi:hypothetical protein
MKLSEMHPPKCEKCVPAYDRRNFLRFSLGYGAGLAAASAGVNELFAQQGPGKTQADKKTTAGGPKKNKKACILLWMGGGPSHLDTWDPKSGKTKGEFNPIKTTGGFDISEHLPLCASQGKHFSIIRSMTTQEGAHERGTELMHIGTRPIPGLQFPSTGTIMSYELGAKDFPLPHFIAIDPPAIPQSTVFGENYVPFRLNSPQNPIPNLHGNRDKRRADLLLEQNAEWEAGHKQAEVVKLKEAYAKSEEIMNTPLLKAFDLGSESGELRSSYSKGGRFGTNCMLARRLVEHGCSFVEIGMGGWDTHNDNFNSLKRMLPNLDAGMGTLIKDMAQSGLLKDTLVMWAGEFGRTPDINGGQGRDHYPRCFSVVLAGGGIQGGRIIGDSGPGGYEPAKNPVNIQTLFATIYHAVGIDYKKAYVTEGRRMPYNYGTPPGNPVKDLF